MTIKLLVLQGTPVKPVNWKEMVEAQLANQPIPTPVYEDQTFAPWKAGAGMSAPGTGDRAVPWPSHGGNLPFGGANPTRAECGGRLRGAAKCECADPVWMVDGEVVDDGDGLGRQESLRQKRLFQDWCIKWLSECFRVLRPGGIIKVFSATRTFHRLAAAMEQVGFILDPKDSLEAWGYGCLTEDTEILTKEGWVPYHSAKVGTPVLAFDLESGRFDWQAVEETFEYPYNQEAFRLVGDGTDHIVSIGHRVVVERAGQWHFVRAQDLDAKEIVPRVSWVFPAEQEGPGNVWACLCQSSPCEAEEAPFRAEGTGCPLCGLWHTKVVSRRMVEESLGADVLSSMQRGQAGAGLGQARSQGVSSRHARGEGFFSAEDVRVEQPCLEGWGDAFQKEGELRQARADSVCQMPSDIHGHGSQGRVCDGTPAAGGPGARAGLDQDRGGTPHQPQPRGQSAGESGLVRLEQGSQAVRGTWDTIPHLAGVSVAVEPVHYRGLVWCVKVPFGAFVARRKGMAFVTGNSGFPKSLNVAKAVQKLQGVNPEVEASIQDYLRESREAKGLTKGQVDDLVFGGTTRYSWVEGRGGQRQDEVYLPTPDEWVKLKEVLNLDDRYDEYIQQAVPKREFRLRADGDKGELVEEVQGDWGYQQDGERWAGTQRVSSLTSNEAKKFEGWGTALKPAFEPFVCGRKPL